MTRILLIEDDPDIAFTLEYNLKKEGGHAVVIARDGERGLEEARARPPDLVLLDLSLPGMDGLEVYQKMRAKRETARVPVIMLTARASEGDKIAGLDLGADDYITKPFSIKELLARVRAVLRRRGAEGEDEVLEDGPLTLSLAERRVLVEGEDVTLTRKEFDLLVDLLRNRGRVLTREKLLERVWGYDYPGETRTVDVHIRRLRKKLGAAAERSIETVVGVGYRFRSKV